MRFPCDCPGGPDAAVRREAIDCATAGLDTSEYLIAATQHSIQGAPARELDPWHDDSPKFEASDEPDLPAKPGELGSEWKIVDAAARSSCEVITEPVQGLDSQSRRSAGRPPGSGSYQAGDLELVEEMRADILAGKHTSIAAAARARVSRAAGFGSEASKEKRLTTRYSERYPA